MGAFILGVLLGAGGTLFLFLYDEGELFLRLARQVKVVTDRYRQQQRLG
jgi:hypothetical protein